MFYVYSIFKILVFLTFNLIINKYSVFNFIFQKNKIQYFQYESDNLNNIYDNYITIKKNKIIIPYYSYINYKLYNISYIFCTLFRYKYICR